MQGSLCSNVMVLSLGIKIGLSSYLRGALLPNLEKAIKGQILILLDHQI